MARFVTPKESRASACVIGCLLLVCFWFASIADWQVIAAQRPSLRVGNLKECDPVPQSRSWQPWCAQRTACTQLWQWRDMGTGLGARA